MQSVAPYGQDFLLHKNVNLSCNIVNIIKMFLFHVGQPRYSFTPCKVMSLITTEPTSPKGGQE